MVLAGLRMSAGSVVGPVAAFSVGAAAWAALGTAATIVVPSAEATFPVTGLIYLPVALLSGVLGPFPVEPGGCSRSLATTLRCWPDGRLPGFWSA